MGFSARVTRTSTICVCTAKAGSCGGCAVALRHDVVAASGLLERAQERVPGVMRSSRRAPQNVTAR